VFAKRQQRWLASNHQNKTEYSHREKWPDNHPQAKNRIIELNDTLPGVVGAVAHLPPGKTNNKTKRINIYMKTIIRTTSAGRKLGLVTSIVTLLGGFAASAAPALIVNETFDPPSLTLFGWEDATTINISRQYVNDGGAFLNQ
jgi:hypothetical protein